VVATGTMRTVWMRPASHLARSATDGRIPRTASRTPHRAHSRPRVAGSTNSAGSWMPRGAPHGTRSASVTATNRLTAVAASVSSTSTPPGRSSRHACATASGRSGTCSRISPAQTTSAQPVASGAARTSPRTGRTPWSAACRRAIADRSTPMWRYPLPATCGASSPPPQPRSTSTAPGRAAAGTSRALAAASQCSIAKVPRGCHHCAARSSYCAGSLRTRTPP
jgi:hypothetical protein